MRPLRYVPPFGGGEIKTRVKSLPSETENNSVKYYFSLLLICLLLACNGGEEARKKENALRDRELALQERELDFKQHQDSLEAAKQQGPRDLADLYADVKDAVFLIYTRSEEQSAQGSAFVISANGLAVSNYHVFENASEAIAVNSVGDRFTISEILAYNEAKDYIIFKIGPDPRGLTPLKIATTDPRIGDACFAVGNPEGLQQTLSTGIISGMRDDNQIQTTAEITHGSSGGALFNAAGEVIGITSSTMGVADLNFALNIHAINLKKYLEPTAEDAAAPTMPSPQEIGRTKVIVTQFYNILKSENYTQLKQVLAAEMKRYYSTYNLPIEAVIKEVTTYNAKKGITVIRTDVDWAKAKFYRLDDGNIGTIFQMQYGIRRAEVNKPTLFTLEMVVEINKAWADCFHF